MSDTVKLIIEIPKDYYELMTKTEVIMTSPRSGKTFMSVIYSAVKNGIPLDDVKAEIEEEYNRLSATRADETLELGECLGLKMALKILDNIGKAESEDKE